MILLELPVSFKDMKTIMAIFEKVDSEIGSYIVDVEGNNLVLNPPFNEVKTKSKVEQ